MVLFGQDVFLICPSRICIHQKFPPLWKFAQCKLGKYFSESIGMHLEKNEQIGHKVFQFHLEIFLVLLLATAAESPLAEYFWGCYIEQLKIRNTTLKKI